MSYPHFFKKSFMKVCRYESVSASFISSIIFISSDLYLSLSSIQSPPIHCTFQSSDTDIIERMFLFFQVLIFYTIDYMIVNANKCVDFVDMMAKEKVAAIFSSYSFTIRTYIRSRYK